jgi:hypothetical protein
MRRPAKVKSAAAGRIPMRKSALTSSAAARRSFPAWIDASERTVAFPAVSATPRVRDALVLRAVTKPRPAKGKGSDHGPGVR